MPDDFDKTPLIPKFEDIDLTALKANILKEIEEEERKNPKPK
jgi:hypothetical protein